MKIIQLEAENIKKIKAVIIRPDGALVQITGPNGQGKSSVLDAIFWALAGTKEIDSVPVRKGEEKASIKLDLGEIVVTRRFTANGGTTLNVEAANGARFPSPQRMLDDLLGTLSFDPLAFSRTEAKAQLETLRKMVKLDVDIDALDAESTANYQVRTGLNRDIKQLEAQAAGITVPGDTPDVPIDVVALVSEMSAAGSANTALEKERGTRMLTFQGIDRTRNEAKTKREAAAKLIQEAETGEALAKQVEEKYTAMPPVADPIDTAPLAAKINAARGINAAVDAKNRRAGILSEIKAKQTTVDGYTKAIDTNTKRRAEAIANAEMPVPGLSFGAGEVLYNGLPLTQASSAEQLRISVAIAMAANPKLRVLRIKDGSLLDETSLQTLADTAELNDFQVWIERVDSSGKVGIVMEDGNARVAESTTAASTDSPLPEPTPAQ